MTAPEEHDLDAIRDFSGRRASHRNIERTSFDQSRPLPEESDGYTHQPGYVYSSLGKGGSQPPRTDSAGNLVAMDPEPVRPRAEVEKPATSVKGFSRSDPEVADGISSAEAAQAAQAASSRQYAPRVTDDDGYRASDYYATKRKSGEWKRPTGENLP